MGRVTAAVTAGRAGARRMLGRIGTLRVKLTIAVAILSAAGLMAGSALLVHAVETTVVRAIEDQSRMELHMVGGQLASGVPLSAIRPSDPWHVLSFVRPDGSRLERRWPDPVDASAMPPPPEPPPAALSCRALPPEPPPRPLPELGPPPPPGAVAIAGPATAVAPPGVPVRALAWNGGGMGFAGGVAPGQPAPGMLRVSAERVGAWSVVQMPLMSPSDGPVEAVALSPLADVLRSTETLQRVLAIGVPALVVVLTLAAWLLIGRALRPVWRMTQSAAGIADATAPERLAVPPTRDELGELARTLNRMLDRLAEGARRQREFVSDASHELRSPIAATRTQIEVALAHPDRAAPAAVLHGVLAEVTRLEVLVADLLALARLEERHAFLDEEIDLDDLVLEDAARSRAILVDVQRVTAVKVQGERKSLGHLVRNLLDNAARHAASRVEVSLVIDDGAPRLIVDDDGPGIPEADRARLFERFTRLSSSRSRDAGGAGLGLAVVRRVAEQHGGRVCADRSPLGGARLDVRFPPAAPR